MPFTSHINRKTKQRIRQAKLVIEGQANKWTGKYDHE